MARWVGLVTTTVAFGTSCIMRLRAFLRFALFLDFLLAHTQALFELPTLPGIIEDCQPYHDVRCPNAYVQGTLTRILGNRANIQSTQHDKTLHLSHDGPIRHISDD